MFLFVWLNFIISDIVVWRMSLGIEFSYTIELIPADVRNGFYGTGLAYQVLIEPIHIREGYSTDVHTTNLSCGATWLVWSQGMRFFLKCYHRTLRCSSILNLPYSAEAISISRFSQSFLANSIILY